MADDKYNNTMRLAVPGEKRNNRATEPLKKGAQNRSKFPNCERQATISHTL